MMKAKNWINLFFIWVVCLILPSCTSNIYIRAHENIFSTIWESDELNIIMDDNCSIYPFTYEGKIYEASDYIQENWIKTEEYIYIHYYLIGKSFYIAADYMKYVQDPDILDEGWIIINTDVLLVGSWTYKKSSLTVDVYEDNYYNGFYEGKELVFNRVN